MPKFLLKLLKVLFYLFLFCLLAGSCYLLTVWRGWPLWLGGTIFAGILALVALILFLRKFYFRRREKHFVRRVIDQDDASIQTAPSVEQENLKDMQTRWTRAVKMLQESKLRMQGNPLYVLPWYMVLGESGSGKTTAIKRSGLTSIITDLSPEAGRSSKLSETLSSTKNVDWCFFQEAIVLDTAGRYAIPLEEGPDKREWENFLALLTRYRRKEPLDGLVVTISTERLINGDHEQLTEYGLSLRKRIDEMMRSMGARFPVYVLVTKLDLLFGLDSLMEILSEQDARQSMGYALDSSAADPEETARNALEHVADRLRELRLPLLSRADHPKTAAITFPEELTSLAPALTAFMRGCFAETPYTETPFLRGIYFSSGRQQGEVQTRLMHKTELFQEKQGISIPNSEKGLFLTDLFATILPGDRGIFTPLKEFLKWRALTRNLVLISWLLFTFFVAGVFTYAYVNTRESLQIATEAFPDLPQLSGEVGHDLYVLSLYANTVELMDQESAKSWVGHMGLNHARQASQELKRAYVKIHRNQFLHPLDKKINGIFSRMDVRELNKHISEYVSYVAWRVNMIEHYLEGKSTDSVQVPPDQALALVMGGEMPQIAPLFKQVYEDYLKWSRVRDVLRAEAQELRMWLKKIITQEGVEMHWLVGWADSQPKVEPVTLGEFWYGPSTKRGTEVRVEGAFTPDGYRAINEFLEQIRAAVQDPDNFDRRKKQFLKWYAAQYYQAWAQFARNFSQGERRLLSFEDWQNQASEMVTLENPYFMLLKRIDSAFKPVSDILEQPVFGKLASDFVHLRSTLISKSKTATLAEKLKEKTKREVKKAVGQFNSKALQDLQTRIEATKSLEEYVKTLKDFLPHTTSLQSGYKFAYLLFGSQGDKNGQGGSSNPLQKAKGELHALKGIALGIESMYADKTELFWDVLSGPLDYMVSYLSKEASCQLQMFWESMVLSRTDNIPRINLRKKLFGKDGLVHKFISGPAKPFIERSRKGWSAQRLEGISFPMHTSFLDFLDQASQNQDSVQDKYTISISALPTDVSKGAQVEPVSTELQLDCEGGLQKLTNFNYQISKDFTWKPGKCGEVKLAINFPSFSLSKTWQGRNGMQKFLREFADDTKKFVPADFEEQKGILNSLDIKSITVAYKMQDAQPVRKLLDQKPPHPPENISRCWYRGY